MLLKRDRHWASFSLWIHQQLASSRSRTWERMLLSRPGDLHMLELCGRVSGGTERPYASMLVWCAGGLDLGTQVNACVQKKRRGKIPGKKTCQRTQSETQAWTWCRQVGRAQGHHTTLPERRLERLEEETNAVLDKGKIHCYTPFTGAHLS